MKSSHSTGGSGDPMAHNHIAMTLALAIVSLLCAGAMAQSSCTSVLISLSPCLNYITSNSTPSSQCCTQLSSVVRSSPRCLCQVLNGGGSSIGININQTRALALPAACHVQTPSISNCNAASPAASPAGTPEVPTTPSGTGFKTIPSQVVGALDGASDGGSIKFSLSLLAFLVFAASYGSIFTAY